jgi:hypothetical protein
LQAQQSADLRRIEAMDMLCRRHQIDAAVAREVLEPFHIVASGETMNAWELLRGSSEPRPHSLDDARALLLPEESKEGPVQ